MYSITNYSGMRKVRAVASVVVAATAARSFIFRSNNLPIILATTVCGCTFAPPPPPAAAGPHNVAN